MTEDRKDRRANLLTTLSRHYDSELVSAVERSCEVASRSVVSRANVGHNTIKHDGRVLIDRSNVLCQADKKRHLPAAPCTVRQIKTGM